MADPTYSVKILKVDPSTIDLEVKAALDEQVYFWPSLAVRVLAEAPGSPLAAFDLSTRDGVRVAADAWIERVDILATRKGLAQFRVVAQKPGLAGKIKKGTTYASSAMHVDDFRYGPGALAAWGKIAAVVILPGSVVTSGAVELIGLTKKGPGATKGWLNHVGVRGVDAFGTHTLTWSPDRVRIWSESWSIDQEHVADVTAACLTTTGFAIGTPEGLILDGDRMPLGPVRALARAEHELHALLASGEVVVFSGKAELRRIKAVPGSMIAASKTDIAVAGDDRAVHWFRDGAPLGTVQPPGWQGRGFRDAVAIKGGLAIGTTDALLLIRTDGTITESPCFEPVHMAASGGLVLLANHGDVVRARIFSDDGAFVGEMVLPPASLHRAQMPSRPPPIRLTWNGDWVLCAENAHENGGVRLVGTRGQGQVRFPSPNANYDFLTDVEQIGPETFLVGYGNHDALLWNLDGSHKSLGRRIDVIWSGHGRLLTSKDKEVTIWDPAFSPAGSFTVDVPYGLHFLEVSGDGKRVVVGTQPRAWVRDLETGEMWEIPQQDGVNEPTFAGHARYLVTGSMAQGDIRSLRIWDVVSRKLVKELSHLRTTRRVHWAAEETLLTAGHEGVHEIGLAGSERCLWTTSRVGYGPHEAASIAFDRKGHLLTHGVQGALYAWQGPDQNRTHSGYPGPGIYEYEPGWCVVLGRWPAQAMRIPG